MIKAKTRKLSDKTIQVYAILDGKEIPGTAHNLYRAYGQWKSDGITGSYKTITEWKVAIIKLAKRKGD